MNSPWSHALCPACYEAEEPGRQPVRIRDQETLPCCRCGQPTDDVIWYRADPKRFDKCAHHLF